MNAPTFGQHEQETAGGRSVDLLLPRPEAIALDDVAHALSQVCRFAGAPGRDAGGVREPVHCSVAEHAERVAYKLIREGYPELAPPGLHHDDAEYVLGDQTRQLKVLLRQLSCPDHDLTWDALDEGVERAVWTALACRRGDPAARPLWNLDDQHHELVKAADTWAALLEARVLLPSEGRGWTQERLAAAWDLDGRWVPTDEEVLAARRRLQRGSFGLSAPDAKRRYLSTHHDLVASPPLVEGARRDVEAT